ncbi:MAG: tetratricopeptide repeat protein [Bacteroidales bacterium]
MRYIRTSSVVLAVFFLLFTSAYSVVAKNKKNVAIPSVQTLLVRPQAEQLEIDALYMDALKQSLIGNEEAALDLYFKLIDKDPNHSVAYYEIARLQIQKKKYKEAIVFAEKALRLLPDNPYYQLLLAEIYKFNGMYTKAIELYENLSKRYPSNLEYTYEWANAYVYQGDIKNAIHVYDLLEKRVGVNDETGMLKYKMYKGINDTKSAIAEIEALSKQYPREIKYLEILAEIYMSQKEYKQALTYYQKILQINPNDPYINISLSDYYRKINEYAQAFSYLAKGIENPNLDFQTKWNVLSVYAQYIDLSKDLKVKAEELFKLMIKAHPKEVTAHHLYGRFLLRQERYKEASDVFSYSLSLDSSMYPVWETLLITEHILGDTAQLEAISKRAVQLFPEQAVLYFYPAFVNYQRAQYDSVIPLAEKVLSLNQGSSQSLETEALLLLADSYYQIKNYDRSFQYFNILIRLDSTNKYVINNYAYYLSLQKKDLDKAQHLIQKLCEKEPENATFLDTYAWVLFQNDKYQEAAKILKKLIEKSTELDATILEHYGDILFKIGNKDEALYYWQKAKTKNSKPSSILEEKIKTKTWIETPLN